jgi:hypothetical protein
MGAGGLEPSCMLQCDLGDGWVEEMLSAVLDI